MSGFNLKSSPFFQIGCILDGVVIRPKSRLKIRHFCPSTGIQVVEDALKKNMEISHRASEIAAMDKVKLFREFPLGFEIINLEEAVKRDPI